MNKRGKNFIRRINGEFVAYIEVPGQKRSRRVSLGTADSHTARGAMRLHGLERLALADDIRKSTQTLQGGILPPPIDHEAAYVRWEQQINATKAPTTVRGYCHSVRGLIDTYALGGLPLTSATPAQLDEFVNHKGKYGSRLCRLAGLRNFYEFYREQGCVKTNPAAMVGVRHREMRLRDMETFVSATMTEPEYRAFLKASPQSLFWRAAATLGWCMGLRISDCITLQYASIEHPNLIVIWTQKRLRRLVLPIDDPLISCNGELRAIIAEVLAKPRTDPIYCFPGQVNTYRGDQWVQSQEFRLKMQGLGSTCTFKSFRKAFVQRCQAAGRTLPDISQMVGHRSIDTTKIYLTA